MGYSSGVLIIFILIATSAWANGQRSEGDSGDDISYDINECPTEVQYVERSDNNRQIIIGNITSHFTDLGTDLLKLATKKDLNDTSNKLVLDITMLLYDLARTADVDSSKNALINKMNALTNTVIDKHEEQLHQSINPINDELFLMKNETMAKFKSLEENVNRLASQTTMDDMNMEIHTIRSMLDNMTNDHLENQLSSLSTEHEEVKILLQNTDSSSLPSKEDAASQSSLEQIKLLKELEELVKTMGCDNTANAKGHQPNQPSKQTFEKSDIFGIISVVALVIMFILVCLLLKRVSAIQNKLNNIQIQVAHERYYRRESDSTPKALQINKPLEQRNGSIKVKPAINMYEDSEMTENLMDKNKE